MTLGIDSSSAYSSTASMLAQLMQATNGQGSVTQAGAVSSDSDEKKGLQSLFASVDSDGDGQISASEFTNFAQRFSVEASSALLSAQEDGGEDSGTFASLDSNGDGSLDEAEFAAGMPSPPPPPPEGGGIDEMASSLFSALDTDGDGTVSAEELSAALSGTDAADGEDSTDAAALLAALDTDGDGAVSESELSSALAANAPPPPEEAQAASAGGGAAPASGAGGSEETSSYDPLDTNEDGYVSFSELMAGLRSGTTGAGLSDGTLSALLQSVAMT